MARRAPLSGRLWLAMLALAPASAFAAPSADQIALADRLMAAIPPSEDEVAMARAAIAERATLEASHPRDKAEIGTVYADYATCLRREVDRGAKDAIRQVALNDLSPADLATLVDFFSGADYARFVTVSERKDKSAPLSADDKRVMAIVETPAMTTFYKAMIARVVESAINGKPPEDADCAAPKTARLTAITGAARAPATLSTQDVSTKDDQ